MKRSDWTRFVLTFAMLFPALATYCYFNLAQDQWLRVIYSISKVIQFTLPAVWVFLILREKFSLQKISLQNAIAGLKTGLALALMILLTYFIFSKFGVMEGSRAAISEKIRAFGVTSVTSFIFLALYISVLHSLLEEYYWRWFVFRKLREFSDFGTSVVISSAAFTLHHIVVISCYAPENHRIPLIMAASLGVFFAGCIWAYQYEKNRSLWGVWISHLMADFAIMYVGLSLSDLT